MRTRAIWVPQVAVSVMLLWALYPENPYGYYVLLRWVCCAAFIFLSVVSFSQKKEQVGWIFGVLALVYNPIMPFYLNRAIWSVINVTTIVVSLVSIRYLRAPVLDEEDQSGE